MTTLAILALLAAITAPLAQIQAQRAKEQALRQALQEIRHALDAYKRACDEGRVRRGAGASGYPADLSLLVVGVEDERDPQRRKIYFLRRIPRDPFADPSLSDEHSWSTRSYASEPDDPQEGDDVYDIHSRSSSLGLNGISYRQW